jgi:Zn-dependent peptidase ImmA (M78 family)
MGIILSPEILLARKIIKKHSLSVPFDLDALVGQYAEVLYKSIPVEGVDGVCLNLKMPGKKHVVIVNSNSVRVRQKFTLAHELGHIIIPWHLGTFIDDIDVSTQSNSANNKYWEIEREANRFASELLMPFEWVYEAFLKDPDIESLISLTRTNCGVSEPAARIRVKNALEEIKSRLMSTDSVLDLYSKSGDLEYVQRELTDSTPFHPITVARRMVECLPGKIAYCIEEYGVVLSSGSTAGTQSAYQFEGNEFDPMPYPHFQSKYIHNYLDINTHWWILDIKHDIPDDKRDWKEILEKIVLEISPIEGADKFKRVVNGRLSGLNGTRKTKNKFITIEAFVDEAIHRFNDYEYINFIKHPDFLSFIKRRTQAFFATD